MKNGLCQRTFKPSGETFLKNIFWEVKEWYTETISFDPHDHTLRRYYYYFYFIEKET